VVIRHENARKNGAYRSPWLWHGNAHSSIVKIDFDFDVLRLAIGSAGLHKRYDDHDEQRNIVLIELPSSVLAGGLDSRAVEERLGLGNEFGIDSPFSHPTQEG
jgi:hypothetical protein